ncbi:CWF19-like protein 2 [Glandiceps talaboti]
MAAPIEFESSWKKAKQRQELREAREHVLEKAKEKFEKRERRKEEARQRGDDVWMLPSVNKRIESEKERTKGKKHKKEKKHKKHKKQKKHKKEKSSLGDDGNSSSGSEDEVEWVVKTDTKIEEDTPPTGPPVKGPQLPPPGALLKGPQRENWMENDPFSFATYTRDDLRKQKKEEKEKLEQEKVSLDKPGQSARELNPFWKDGGTGMPEDKPDRTSSSAPVSVGDGGLSWLKKAYDRACQEAEDTNRPVEDVIADRYESMEKFERMMKEAEEMSGKQKQRDSAMRYKQGDDKWRTDRRDRDMDRRRDRDRYRDRDRDMDRHSNIDRDRDRDRDRNRDRPRTDHREIDKDSGSYRDRDADRYGNKESDSHKDRLSYRERDRYSDRDRDRRDSREHERRDRHERQDRYTRSERETEQDSSKGESDSNKPSDSYRRKGLLSSLTGTKFMRPSDSVQESTTSSKKSSSRDTFSRDTDAPRWKSKTFMKPSEDMESSATPTTSTKSDHAPAWKNKSFLKPTSEVSKSPEKDNDSQHSDESADSSESSGSEEERAPSPVMILTEKEMNELGAKLVKAEIMGDEETAARIKSQLEASRKAKETQAVIPRRTDRNDGDHDEEEEESEVILTRTDRTGQSWPIQQTMEREEGRGKKRRKKKVATHDTGGKRERYFADDDRYDLKSMVQRERMSTAEDQNAMFARLAGRAVEKTDQDNYTLDDMFVSRATKEMSQAEIEERDRAKAIAEHRRQTKQLDKCIYCFGNKDMPKHLIAAIGLQVYLCLPSHQSLTDGHCQIIPMQHCVSSTMIDEDVWNEIKIFRKGLTKMFEELEMDTIFLETCMNPKKQRHMLIDCIPVPKEEGGMADIYFKKAIMESESEWSQNKKLVDTRQKDIRRSVPKGLPYFSVDFGLEGGFAHVIEDDQLFPHYFGKEVIGGILDLEPRRWRNPPKQSFEDHRQKVLKFAEWWKPYDWTQKIERD